MQIKIDGKWVNDNNYVKHKVKAPNLSCSWEIPREERLRQEQLHEATLKILNKK